MFRTGLGVLDQQRWRCLWTTSPPPPPPGRRHGKFMTRSLPHSEELAILGLTPMASKTDIKHAYKRLALKYHPDVIREDNGHEKQDMFKEIKSAYESLMEKLEVEEELQTADVYDEDEEWDEWMGFEGGIPVIYNTF